MSRYYYPKKKDFDLTMQFVNVDRLLHRDDIVAYKFRNPLLSKRFFSGQNQIIYSRNMTEDSKDSIPAPPPAKLLSRTDFSITLEVPEPRTSLYRFQYKKAGSHVDWDSQGTTIDTEMGQTTIILDDLEPTRSYEVRIYALDSTQHTICSSPSAIAAVDTDVPSCAPDSKCVIL
uniref:Uncharacterized protein AlNc14C1G129 n=1 Tax=Albugo laibachii Nc14 TaxID=890382 RepID=F0VYX8_9STRA|nr:conserved hypothetical protein [Albugo laibachii Nc14]|eukprot:CCA13993.1 conserved hypothetical protein [Albugo laibachii Nc14]